MDAVKAMPPPENIYDHSWVLYSSIASFCPNWPPSQNHFIASLRQEYHGFGVKNKQKLFWIFLVQTLHWHILIHLFPLESSVMPQMSGWELSCFIGTMMVSEHHISNSTKTLTATQQGYSQIQKEALTIIFAIIKFHQFLYAGCFILVTDHKPLLALFGPTKASQAFAVNRLACWALMLSQYVYSIEYQKISNNGNAMLMP